MLMFDARFNASTLQRFNVLAILVFSLFASCGGQHFHIAAPGEGPENGAPLSVELLGEAQAATLHFPAGVYSFYARDDAGYYYRAPRKILEHTRGSSIPHNGGVYVYKDMRRLRGYVYLAGAITHVGNLSRTPHEFHD